jgi:poly-gamma-glutamate synthesis protein (capsule biosynthesis protein)
VAFLAASRVIPTVDWYAGRNKPGLLGTYDPSILNEQIKLAKESADYVFVYVHWGVERSTIPESWQRAMAFGYIDAGADAVIGCHPHVLQGFEFYKGKLIAYSLGNFIWTDARMDTAALELTLTGNGGLAAKLYPYEIVDRATLTIDDAQRLESLRRHLTGISFNAEVNEGFEIIEKH